MNAQVIFLNKQYFPGQEELRRLDHLQDKLHFALVELRFALRDESRYQQAVTKISYHEKFRKRWKIIDGDKE